MRGATLFSGGGGVEARLKDCINFVHAVEYDPAIAAVYRANHGDHIQVADVCDVDYTAWGALDYLHASPVCKNASQAKTGGVESDTDIRTAQAVVRCLEATQPRVFTLENVGGYQRFAAYRLICQALDRAGYMWHAEVLNAADYGVPQTRRRLILRAVKGALLPGWPAPLPWVGWFESIEDLIPGLPESRFADWQLARLPEEMSTALVYGENTKSNANGILQYSHSCEPTLTLRASMHAHGAIPRAFIVHANDQRSMPVRDADEPMFTVAAASHASHAPDTKPKAFIMGNNDPEWGLPYKTAEQPMMSLTTQTGSRARAFLVGEDSKMGMVAETEPNMTIVSSPRAINARAWLSQGRVVKMTPRALARFQSLPDSFILPEKSSLACTVIGNAVPSLLMREIVRPLL